MSKVITAANTILANRSQSQREFFQAVYISILLLEQPRFCPKLVFP